MFLAIVVANYLRIMTNLLLQTNTIETFVNDLLLALECPPESAGAITTSLIEADVCGVNTHGIAQLPMYAMMVSDGAINPRATPTITHKTDCIISIDGHDGFGQLTGQAATAAGIAAAKKFGVSTVGLHNATHLGRLGEWAGQAAKAGLVFTAFSNTGGGATNVAAFGGHERKLSTNPVAFAVPTFSALPFNIVVDFATSQISGAAIHEHFRTGTPLHPDWTISASGEALINARDFMDGNGALLPLGGRTTGHKGFGLAIVAELLGGIAGGRVIGQHQPEWFSNAAMFSFLDPLHFQDVDEIKEKITAVVGHLDEDKVRLPGQGTYECAQLTKKQGLCVAPHVLQSLARLASKLDVEMMEEIETLIGNAAKPNEERRSW